MSMVDAGEKRTPARQVRLTPSMAQDICKRLSEGQTLASICSRKGMPRYTTVNKWLNEVNPDRTPRYPEFVDAYRKARQHQADYYLDDIIEIADRKSLKATNRDRLRIDSRKWVMSRLNPEKYGDKVEHSHQVSGTVEILDARQGARAVLELLRASEDATVLEAISGNGDEQG